MAMTPVVLRGFPRLSLSLYEMVEDIQGTGIMVARRRGAPVILTEGRNEVDPEFWAKWREQNKVTNLVTDGIITADDDQQQKASPDGDSRSESYGRDEDRGGVVPDAALRETESIGEHPDRPTRY